MYHQGAARTGRHSPVSAGTPGSGPPGGTGRNLNRRTVTVRDTCITHVERNGVSLLMLSSWTLMQTT